MTTTRIVLAGDINLLGVEDPTVPFRKVAPALHAADAVFARYAELVEALPEW